MQHLSDGIIKARWKVDEPIHEAGPILVNFFHLDPSLKVTDPQTQRVAGTFNLYTNEEAIELDIELNNTRRLFIEPYVKLSVLENNSNEVVCISEIHVYDKISNPEKLSVSKRISYLKKLLKHLRSIETIESKCDLFEYIQLYNKIARGGCSFYNKPKKSNLLEYTKFAAIIAHEISHLKMQKVK